MQTLKIDPLYLKTTHGYARTRVSVPVQLAQWLNAYIQSGPTLPEDRQRRRDDDAA
ncbi:hypothetical protein [Cupriavidus basilensis]